MKRIFTILVVAASAALGLSLSSCQKFGPSEITPEARTNTATIEAQVQLTGAPVKAGTEVVFTITDSETNATYVIKRETNSSGIAKLEVGCGQPGVSVAVSCQYTLNAVHYYGSAGASLDASSKYYKKVTVNL